MKTVSSRCSFCFKELTFDYRYITLLRGICLECPLCHNMIKGVDIISANNCNGDKPLIGLEVVENFLDETGNRDTSGKFYSIEKTITYVGRKSGSSKADIQIPSNKYMSRSHILITKVDNEFYVQGCSSINPPLINSRILDKDSSVMLNDGDMLILGQCTLKWVNNFVND